MSHFELLRDDTLRLDDRTILYRIRATRGTMHAKEGELGGYVEYEKNLKGKNAWVGENSIVVGEKATVRGNALVDGNSTIRNTLVSKNMTVRNSRVKNCILIGDGCVEDSVAEDSYILDNAEIYGSILKDTHASKNVVVHDALLSNRTILTSQREFVIVRGEEHKLDFSQTEKYAEELAGRGIYTQKVFSEKYREKKYFELTKETKISSDGEPLRRIRATEPIPELGIIRGELGGFVSSINSLENGAWIGKENSVCGDLVLSGTKDAVLHGSTEMKTREDVEVAKHKSHNETKRKYYESLKQKPVKITM